MSSSLYKNECFHKNCQQTYQSLAELITHIEMEHLDFSRNKMEQLEKEPPDCIPLSYVLRFSNVDDPTPQSIESCNNNTLMMMPSSSSSSSQMNQLIRNNKKSVMVRRQDRIISEPSKEVIPTLREVMESMNNNYITYNFGVEFNAVTSEIRLKQDDIPKEVSQLLRQKLFSMDNNLKKPFGCNMPGCHKRYKNINGIKYHYKTHHKLHIPVFKKSVLKYKPPPHPSQTTHQQQHSKIKMERPSASNPSKKACDSLFLPLVNAASSVKSVDQFYTRNNPKMQSLSAFSNTNICALNNNCFSYGSEMDEQLPENCFSFSFSDFED